MPSEIPAALCLPHLRGFAGFLLPLQIPALDASEPVSRTLPCLPLAPAAPVRGPLLLVPPPFRPYPPSRVPARPKPPILGRFASLLGYGILTALSIACSNLCICLHLFRPPIPNFLLQTFTNCRILNP